MGSEMCIRDSLDVLDEASAGEIQPEMVITSTTKTPTARQQEAKAKHDKSMNLKDNVTMNAMTTFLCSIIDLLKASSEVHKSLFEGFTYCVFTKVGLALYTTTFGQTRGATIEKEIFASTKLTFDDNGSASPTDGEQNIQLRRAILQAPYLVHVLTRIMVLAHTHLGTAVSVKSGRAKQANSAGSIKATLAVAAKVRLQRTLVNLSLIHI